MITNTLPNNYNEGDTIILSDKKYFIEEYGLIEGEILDKDKCIILEIQKDRSKIFIKSLKKNFKLRLNLKDIIIHKQDNSCKGRKGLIV